MKLRNKKTGKVANVIFYSPIGNYTLRLMEDADYLDVACDDKCLGVYKTLAELNEEWEDYAPAEPLIKDEKIRKAVRAWAEAWGKNRLYKDADNVLSTVDNFVIQFGQTAFIDLEEKRPYTIAELCGEEEE